MFRDFEIEVCATLRVPLEIIVDYLGRNSISL
jgi:hypothetical protein